MTYGAPASADRTLSAAFDQTIQGFRVSGSSIAGGVPVSVYDSAVWTLLDSGLVVPGQAPSNPNGMLIAGLTPDNPQLAAIMQVDQFGNMLVARGDQTDPFNDNIGITPTNGFPQQIKFNFANAAATITVPLAPGTDVNGNPVGQLGMGGMPNAAALYWAQFTVSNHGTTQNLTGLKLNLFGTVDGTSVTYTYTYPLAFTLASGAAPLVFWLLIPAMAEGFFNQATLTGTLASGSGVTTAAYLQVQVLWGFNPVQSLPMAWRWSTVVNLTNATTTSVLAAPVANARIVVDRVLAVNRHATADTTVTLQQGSGGSTLGELQNYVKSGGLGWAWRAADWREGVPVATGTALFAVSSANPADVLLSVGGHYSSI